MMSSKVLKMFNITAIQLINKASQKVYINEAKLRFSSFKIYSNEKKNGLLSAAYGAAISTI